MTSPLSMLKKSRRNPLPGRSSDQWSREKVAAARRNLLKELQGDESCDQNPLKPGYKPAWDATTSTTKPKPPLKKEAPPSDFELLSSTMQRVNILEKQVRSQAQDLESKNKKISALEEKLRLQEESERARDVRGGDDLERRCEELQSQVQEMEKFLNDYGLTWVGDEDASDSADSEQTHGGGAGAFHMNFDLVLRRIKELNIVAGEGQCFVRSTSTGAQLAQKDPVRLRLYSNGIVMFNGPFRSYQEHSTQQCMMDLMDGCFPSELQDRFPDGVPFDVLDRRNEEFTSNSPWEKFPGEGRAVCRERDDLPNVVTTQTHGWKQSTDQFLSSVPKVVVRAGRVIDIRDSLRAKLQGSSDSSGSDSVILIETAAQLQTQRQQTAGTEPPPPPPPSACDTVTLKLRSEDGDCTYVLKMLFRSETIGHVRQYLDKHRGSSVPPGYDIISAFPQCRYDDDGRMLQSCGLATNATLLLRRRRQPPPPTAAKQVGP